MVAEASTFLALGGNKHWLPMQGLFLKLLASYFVKVMIL